MTRYLLVTKEYSDTPTSGGMLRTKAIAEELARHGDVVVVSPTGVTGAPLERTGTTQRGWSDPELARIYQCASGYRIGKEALLRNLFRATQQSYDGAVLDHTCLAGLHDRVAEVAPRVVVSMHNVESRLMRDRGAAAPSRKEAAVYHAESLALRRLERRAMRRGPVLTVSEDDARVLGGTTVVARNGVFDDQIIPPAPDRVPRSLLFTGALDWEPNVDGVLWFVRTHWDAITAKMPDATLTIAGRNPDERVLALTERPGVTVAANVPDMRPLLAGHAVGVAPLHTGGGSRIKILEYLAAGMGVVATTVGASGLEDIPDAFIERADGDAFPLAVLHALDRADGSAGRAAQDWIRDTYTWRHTMAPLGRVLTGGTATG